MKPSHSPFYPFTIVEDLNAEKARIRVYVFTISPSILQVSLTRPPAGGAYARVFQAVAKHLVALYGLHFIEDRFRHRPRYIIHPTALHAPYMTMPLHPAVEPRLPALSMYFHDHARFSEKIEIAIDGSETDPWKFLSYNLVKLLRRGMRMKPAKLGKDNAPLRRISVENPGFHSRPFNNNDYY
jgi:hypothetical protein